MKTVLITGGSGMVGRRLSQLLISKGYKVIWYSRERYVKAKIPRYKWDYRNGYIDNEALQVADYIVHLAGANIGEEKWTRSRKRSIVDSRVQTANLLLDTLMKLGKRPEAFISASAVGYYGTGISESIFTEQDVLNGTDFLSTTCQQWESASKRVQDELGVRTVILRTGVVISRDSDAFRKMMLPVRFGMGSPLGKGNQYLSWIHIDDLCNMYLKAIEDGGMFGVYNAGSPCHVTNAQFMRRLARGMHRPFFMPNVPQFVLRILMGESADLVLGGSRVSAEKIQQEGFKYQYSDVDKAIRTTLKAIAKDKK